MIVRDFDRVRPAVSPNEADSVLIVDANTMLSFAVVFQFLQAVAWRNWKVIQSQRNVNHKKLSECDSPQVRRWNAFAPASIPEFPRLGIGKAPNHEAILTESVNNVHRS
jgi:hypothetical protein